ncbi:hypothetical protein GN156_33625, partial [bacterium LRH843]|nr:hypothetical protein [bacterium LRH843]
SFEDPRVRLLMDDGLKFLKKTNKFYDLILVNTAQPFGPAKTLFKREFFEHCHKALNPGGILVTQNGSPIIQMDNIIKYQEIRKD